MLGHVSVQTQTRALCLSLNQDLEKFGVDPDNIMNGILDSNYKELMRYQIARARFYYKQAARGIPMLSPEGRLPVQVILFFLQSGTQKIPP